MSRPPIPIPCPPDLIPLLRALPLREIQERAGVSKYMARKWRKEHHPDLPKHYRPDQGWSTEALERQDQIRALRSTGMTLRQVGECVGLNRERVRQILTQLPDGDPCPDAGAEQQAEESARVTRVVAFLAKEGFTDAEIGRLLECGKSAVHGRRVAAGIPAAKPRPDRDCIAKMRAAYLLYQNEGLRWKSVSELLGVSNAVVSAARWAKATGAQWPIEREGKT